jgi:hypothetical protein
MRNIFLILIIVLPATLSAQNKDSTTITGPLSFVANQQKIIYKKPKYFSFLTNIPKDLADLTKQSFRKQNYKNLTVLAGTTAILLFADQSITNTLQSNLRKAHIQANEDFSPLGQFEVREKNTNLWKKPNNINTAFYNLGQGSFSMMFAAGFFILGKIKKDNRALQTASQLTEAFIALGATTQLMKFATGRENPSDATVSRGRWQPFPSFGNFQNNKPKYDAFPSGHLATFVSTVTIIGENYPEIKWINPVGYGITGLIGLAMINNGVHWASDFPLGVALGYGFGKFISRKSHFTFVP